MKVFQMGRRFALVMSVLIGTLLVGCASPVSINKTRTSMMVTHVVAPPGVEGMSTSETERCRFKGGMPISEELAAEYLKDPAKAISDGACEQKDVKQTVQGAPSLGGQMVLGFSNALSGGVVNYAIQNALQRQQQDFCNRHGGCGDGGTTINNLNQSASTAAAQSQQQQSSTVNAVPAAAPLCVAQGNCGK